MKGEQRTYKAPWVNLAHLAHSLAEWYRSQNYQAQILDVPDGGVVIQARQAEAWRSILGMSSSLNVALRREDDLLIVTIGAGKWMDKALAGAVGWFILWPLLFTAAYGAWQQAKLPERTFDFIERYLASGGKVPLADMEAWQAGQYSQARHYVQLVQRMQQAQPTAPTGSPSPATQEPSTLETQTQAQARAQQPETEGSTCPQCGTALPKNARFCPQCGHAVTVPPEG